MPSRGDDGQITFRDWHPVGVEEYGYVAPDPLDPDIVYGGKVSRYDRRTGQVQNVAPRPLRGADYRVVRTAPVLFSPIDPRKLLLRVERRLEDDERREELGADQPGPHAQDSVVPPNVGMYIGATPRVRRQRGVMYTIAPSSDDVNTIWAGTTMG